jgi:hypothetical protein
VDRNSRSLGAWVDDLIVRVDPRRWSPRYVAWRVLLTVGMIGVVAMFYYPASLATAARSHDLTTALDRAIPFVPWTWWIYFPHYVLGLMVTTVVLPDPRVAFRIFLAIVFGQVISCTVYFLLPSAYPRPLTPGDADPVTSAALVWFWGIDPPNNTFPSTHVANACLAALGAWKCRHPIRWYTTVMALGVFVTVHTAKQHYWIDAVGGVVVAVACYHLAFRWWPLNAAGGQGAGTGRPPAVATPGGFPS